MGEIKKTVFSRIRNEKIEQFFRRRLKYEKVNNRQHTIDDGGLPFYGI
jgi:hypothetical protein